MKKDLLKVAAIFVGAGAEVYEGYKLLTAKAEAWRKTPECKQMTKTVREGFKEKDYSKVVKAVVGE